MHLFQRLADTLGTAHLACECVVQGALKRSQCQTNLFIAKGQCRACQAMRGIPQLGQDALFQVFQLWQGAVMQQLRDFAAQILVILKAQSSHFLLQSFAVASHCAESRCGAIVPTESSGQKA